MTLTLPLKPLVFGTPTAPHQGLGEMVSSLVGSEILRIAGEVRALAEKGQPVLNLTVGDFSPKQFRIPRELEQGIARALAAGQTNYPPSDGVPELKRAVTDFYREALALDYPQDGILVAGGARPLIYALFRAVLDPGDKVVYPVPSWNNNHYCHLAAARDVAVETTAANGFQPTAGELAPHLADARLLALNSPLNPAGTGFSRDQLQAIAQLVVDENRRRGCGRSACGRRGPTGRWPRSRWRSSSRRSAGRWAARPSWLRRTFSRYRRRPAAIPSPARRWAR